MAKAPQPSNGDESDVADARFLFEEPVSKRAIPRGPKDTFESTIEEGYDLEPQDDPPVVEVPAPRIPDSKSRRSAARPQPVAPTDDETEQSDLRSNATKAEAARVDQVWSRGAEWGPTLTRLAVIAIVVGALVYLALSSGMIGMGFLLLLLGGAALVLLSYPIVITMERPVRITPEQALKDYFDALSHHFPHYRRMWLLLSDRGRYSVDFDSFDGFKKYWKRTLAELRGGRVKNSTPLDFKVADFKSEKSAGKSAIEATFTIQIFARGQESEEPLKSLRYKSGLVKGPDNMWYLNRGTLPDGRDS